MTGSTDEIKMHLSADATYDVDVVRLELLEAALDADEHRFCVIAGVVAPDGLGIIPGVVGRGELRSHQCKPLSIGTQSFAATPL